MMCEKVCSDILPHFGVTSCLARALPHENLPLSASSISFPPILFWSPLLGRCFAHQLSSWRSIWHPLERKRKILHEANKGRSLSTIQTDRPLCFSRGEEDG